MVSVRLWMDTCSYVIWDRLDWVLVTRGGPTRSSRNPARVGNPADHTPGRGLCLMTSAVTATARFLRAVTDIAAFCDGAAITRSTVTATD